MWSNSWTCVLVTLKGKQLFRGVWYSPNWVSGKEFHVQLGVLHEHYWKSFLLTDKLISSHLIIFRGQKKLLNNFISTLLKSQLQGTNRCNNLVCYSVTPRCHCSLHPYEPACVKSNLLAKVYNWNLIRKQNHNKQKIDRIVKSLCQSRVPIVVPYFCPQMW